ncbi:hypothetical protein Acid345_3162 [Candidatus Koribacter versatilis Ellin345]|uniref:Uncharacterized protein n=1 Tax=Koribacter versatilis (strain Ellin345) TaxID=204669 RepID=Q1ILT7_KORVE|nr:hypothetical protein Acid345_3162 [Candidatus Koribacter versatilis Ellin345]
MTSAAHQTADLGARSSELVGLTRSRSHSSADWAAKGNESATSAGAATAPECKQNEQAISEKWNGGNRRDGEREEGILRGFVNGLGAKRGAVLQHRSDSAIEKCRCDRGAHGERQQGRDNNQIGSASRYAGALVPASLADERRHVVLLLRSTSLHPLPELCNG